MNFSTRVFLVLLQLAIGWHLVYEGYWKTQEKAWSSKGYLRNASGPLAPSIRWLAGDPDVAWQDSGLAVRDPNVEFLTRFEIIPLDPNEAPSDRRLHKYMPPILAQEWQGYYDRFVEHYQLGKIEDKPPPKGQQDRRVQLDLAKRNFTLSQNETVEWLLNGTKKVKRPHFAGPEAEAKLTTQQRVQEYKNKIDEIGELQGKVGVFGPKVSPQLRKAQQEEAALRKDLMDDLNAQTANMKKGLRDVLTFDQKRMDLPKEPAAPEVVWSRFNLETLKWIDRIVKFGLLAAGICLILGLFTRTACLAGSMFLLMFYAAMPPLGLTPAGAPSEGHFLIINNNIIEILALMTVAVSRPYLRYGLDVGLYRMMPWNWQKESQPRAPTKDPQPRPPDRMSVGSPAAVTSSNEGVAARV